MKVVENDREEEEEIWRQKREVCKDKVVKDVEEEGGGGKEEETGRKTREEEEGRMFAEGQCKL